MQIRSEKFPFFIIKFLFKINLLKILRTLLNKFAQVALGYDKIVNVTGK